MQIFAFSDIHGKWDVLRSIIEKDADIYICLGDLTYGEIGMEEASKILEPIFDRLLCVPGNNERPKTMRLYFPLVLHGDAWECKNIRFGGIGGCPRTPFHTIHEWDEREARDLLARIGSVDVLLSHAPPAGTRLSITKSGIDAGSKALREYIESVKPKLVLCGHIHERAGEEDRIGDTRIINPGPRGMYIEL